VYYNASTRTEKYAYDNMGNRLNESITVKGTRVNNYGYYADGNRLKTNGRWVYRYDPNGNLIEKGDTVTFNGTATRVKDLPTSFFAALTQSTQEIAFGTDNKGTHYKYEYDLLNRMTSVSKNGTVTAEYTYSWKGLRILKQCPDALEGETAKTWYVYSVNGKVLYEEEEIKTTDSGENKYSQYVYLFGRHFAREDGTVDSSGTVSSITVRYYMHTDHLGSTVAVTDQTGKTVWDNEYNPFGGLAD